MYDCFDPEININSRSFQACCQFSSASPVPTFDQPFGDSLCGRVEQTDWRTSNWQRCLSVGCEFDPRIGQEILSAHLWFIWFPCVQSQLKWNMYDRPEQNLSFGVLKYRRTCMFILICPTTFPRYQQMNSQKFKTIYDWIGESIPMKLLPSLLLHFKMTTGRGKI